MIKLTPKSQVVLDTICFLEGRVTELNGKVEDIDAIDHYLDGLLMFRVDSLEERVA